MKCWLMVFMAFSTLLFAEGWTHLELGGGNYGLDGHSKVALKKTVLMKVGDVSNVELYFDGVEEEGRDDYKPEEQYGVLFWTLDQLVARYGEVGVFHVNDLYEEYATYATQKLIEYAVNKGYDSVIIEAVPGDYELIDAAHTLSKYGKSQYQSMHLKNPENSFFHDRIDGEQYYTSEKMREQTRAMLKNLASLSDGGLYLFIIDHIGFIPPEEKAEFMEMDIFYHKTTEWEAVPYIFPDGALLPKEMGKVFHIFPSL